MIAPGARRRWSMKRTLLALALMAPLFDWNRAEACGGFFCSVTPIDQSGEKILFALDQNGIEVHVQIAYTGNDADFAWVVPTRKPPTLGVGVDALFTALGQATSPRFQPTYHYPSCSSSL